MASLRAPALAALVLCAAPALAQQPDRCRDPALLEFVSSAARPPESTTCTDFRARVERLRKLTGQ